MRKPKPIPSQAPHGQKRTVPGVHNEPIRPRSGSSWQIPAAVIITIIFVIYGVIHYFMNTEPYRLSETFFRQNQTIKAEIGDVVTCDPWYPIEMYPFGPDDHARLTFDAIGTNKGSIEVSVSLQKKGEQWRIVSASYKDGKGIVKPLVQELQAPPKKSSNEKRLSP
jgi:hypothetical protein